MPELKQCEFYVVRYVPDVVKGEFVNVGVVLLETGGDEAAFTDVRFTRDWRRARCLDPDVDIELLEALEDDLRRVLQSRVAEIINYKGPMSRREWLLGLMQESFSGAVELAEMGGVEAESPEAELGVLAKQYLESTARAARTERVARGRHAIYAAMRSAFEAQGVWELMQKDIAAEEYTRPGDPFKVDCGYQPNGVLHLFQALALAAETSGAGQVNAAKALAFSYGELREGLMQKRGLMSDLTAVVEDRLDASDRAVGFALATLAESEMVVARAGEMRAIAERARVELGL